MKHLSTIITASALIALCAMPGAALQPDEIGNTGIIPSVLQQTPATMTPAQQMNAAPAAAPAQTAAQAVPPVYKGHNPHKDWHHGKHHKKHHAVKKQNREIGETDKKSQKAEEKLAKIEQKVNTAQTINPKTARGLNQALTQLKGQLTKLQGQLTANMQRYGMVPPVATAAPAPAADAAAAPAVAPATPAGTLPGTQSALQRCNTLLTRIQSLQSRITALEATLAKKTAAHQTRKAQENTTAKAVKPANGNGNAKTARPAPWNPGVQAQPNTGMNNPAHGQHNYFVEGMRRPVQPQTGMQFMQRPTPPPVPAGGYDPNKRK